jgi:hypothetical protein
MMCWYILKSWSFLNNNQVVNNKKIKLKFKKLNFKILKANKAKEKAF